MIYIIRLIFGSHKNGNQLIDISKYSSTTIMFLLNEINSKLII